jgi:Mn-containing catalase
MKKGVVSSYPRNLHHIRTNKTFWSASMQHVTSQDAYVIGPSLTLAQSNTYLQGPSENTEIFCLKITEDCLRRMV